VEKAIAESREQLGINSQTQSDLQSQLSAITQAQVSLQSELDNAAQQQAQLTAERDALIQTRATEAQAKEIALQERDALARAKKAIQTQLESLTQDCAELQTQLAKRNQSHDELQIQFGAVSKTKSDLQGQLRSISQAQADLQSKLEDSAKHQVQLMAERNALTQTCAAETQAKVLALQERDALAKAKDLESIELAQRYEKEIAKFQDQVVQEKKSRTDLQKLVDQSMGKLAHQQLDLQSLHSQLDSQAISTTLLEQRNAELAQLHAQLLEAQKRQMLMNDALLKSEAQIELIKDLCLREPGI
jgi:hypothetical protein